MTDNFRKNDTALRSACNFSTPLILPPCYSLKSHLQENPFWLQKYKNMGKNPWQICTTNCFNVKTIKQNCAKYIINKKNQIISYILNSAHPEFKKYIFLIDRKLHVLFWLVGPRHSGYSFVLTFYSLSLALCLRK